jgi:hypothetical protein
VAGLHGGEQPEISQHRDCPGAHRNGPLVAAGVGLPALFGSAAVAAVIVGGLSLVFAAGTRQLPLLFGPAGRSGKREAR